MFIESTVVLSLLEIIIAIMQLQTTTQALLEFIGIFNFVICAGSIENVCASTVGFIPFQMS